MYLTLDILSDKDPSITEDRTNEWESRLEEDSAPKLKFPLKMKDDIIEGEIEFKDPVIKSPPKENKKPNNSSVVIDMRNKNKNKNKNNIF